MSQFLYRNYGYRILNTSRMFNSIWDRLEAEDAIEETEEPIHENLNVKSVIDPSPQPSIESSVGVSDNIIASGVELSRTSTSMGSSESQSEFELDELNRLSDSSDSVDIDVDVDVDVDVDAVSETDVSIEDSRPMTLTSTPPFVRTPSLLVLLRSTPTPPVLVFSDEYFKFTLHTQQVQVGGTQATETPEEKRSSDTQSVPSRSSESNVSPSVPAVRHLHVRLNVNVLSQLLNHMVQLTSQTQPGQTPPQPTPTSSQQVQLKLQSDSSSSQLITSSPVIPISISVSPFPSFSPSNVILTPSTSTSFLIPVSASAALVSGGWSLLASLSTS